jgi:uncharacterized protein YndB with AHSA1/START domain
METTHTVLVNGTAEQAFSLFVERLGEWWPKEYTWSSANLVKIGIEPFENGKCYEVGSYGFRYDWGRVLTIEPPHHILFTWQIAPNRVPEPDPEKSSRVDVTFRDGDGVDSTLVTLVHDGFERHGESGEIYREGMASDAGWPYMLSRFADLVHAGLTNL